MPGAMPSRGTRTDWKKWAEMCLRKVHSKKCKVLHLGRNITRCQNMSSTTHMENRFAGKDLGVLMETKFNVRKWCFLAIKNATDKVGCIRRTVTWWLRDLIYTFSPFLVRPHVEYWIQFCAPCYKRNMGILEKCIFRQIFRQCCSQSLRSPAYISCGSCLNLGARTCTWMCWISWDSLGPTAQACLGLSEWHPSGVLTSSHSLVSSANLLRVHLSQMSMSLMNMLKSIGPSTDPLGTWPITDLHLDTVSLTTTLWTQSCSPFFIHNSQPVNIFAIWKERRCVVPRQRLYWSPNRSHQWLFPFLFHLYLSLFMAGVFICLCLLPQPCKHVFVSPSWSNNISFLFSLWDLHDLRCRNKISNMKLCIIGILNNAHM